MVKDMFKLKWIVTFFFLLLEKTKEKDPEILYFLWKNFLKKYTVINNHHAPPDVLTEKMTVSRILTIGGR